jgi:2-hydroxychromene-2-carboxylate isomerase
MAKQVEFLFDYVSPFSYLADSQVASLRKRTGAEVIYKPAILGAIFKATNNTPPPSISAKLKYYAVDAMRWARHYGVPMQPNPFFPMNTLRALRGAIVAQSEGRFAAYHEAVFRAMWVEGRNLSDAAVMGTIFEQVGLDSGAVKRDDIREKLKAITDEAIARGAFGVPTFFVGDAMFWGNDRLQFVEETLR